MPHIFLAGGGDAEQARAIDSAFAEAVRELGKAPERRRVLYLPHAMPEEQHPSALAWFKESYGELFPNVTYYADINAALKQKWDVIYLGGGNSGHLLDQLRACDGQERMKKHIQGGGILYGGSAGAVVLGSTIATVGEDEQSPNGDRGLDLLPHSAAVVPHLQDPRDVLTLANKLGCVVWGIPENGGMTVSGDGKVVGSVGEPSLTTPAPLRGPTFCN